MLNRQKAVLQFLQSSGGQISRIKLTKLVFLLGHETLTSGGKAFYQFLPYKYGPYSFSLFQEVGTLQRDGWVTTTNQKDLVLTSPIQEKKFNVPKVVAQDIDRIVTKYGTLSTAELLEKVYSKYPWFTVKSSQPQKHVLSLPIAKPKIYTAGYEKLMVEGFLNLLLESGIQRLIDVRCNPISRRYGFHKTTLSRLCNLLSVDYQHFPELGISSMWRESLNTETDYNRLFARYKQETLSNQTQVLKKVTALLKEKASVLVCQEANPMFCHRSHLAAVLCTMTDLPIENLGWPR